MSPIRVALVALAVFCGTTPGIDGQVPAGGARVLTIGILPFVDATSTGGRESGAAISRTMQTAMIDVGTLSARALALDSGVRIEELDRAQAIDMARRQNLDLLFVGTVLEASTSESRGGGWLPRVNGQQLNVNVRSIKAKVTLQGELYDVATSRTIATLRGTGDHSDSKFQGTLWSSLGSWDVGNTAFLDSPLGKALQKAVASLVKQTVGAARVGG